MTEAPPALDFWYDFASTYSYPAVERIGALAQAGGVAVRWRPFLLGPIFARQGWTDTPFKLYPVKGTYMWRDLERLCQSFGLPWRRPSRFPQSGLLAARVFLAGAGAEWCDPLHPAGLSGEFRATIATSPIPRRWPRSCGASARTPTPFSNGRSTAEVKLLLRRETEEAERRGIFGAPSFTDRR